MGRLNWDDLKKARANGAFDTPSSSDDDTAETTSNEDDETPPPST